MSFGTTSAGDFVKGACTIWGDPHINTFDSGLFGAENAVPVSILTSGDYWLVPWPCPWGGIEVVHGYNGYSPHRSGYNP